MNIKKIKENKQLTLVLEGRLDTTTAPELETQLKADINNIELLVFDFSSLEYLSSAGLRVLLGAQKIMNCNGKMILKNVNETIMEVFEITGFSNILTIE